MLKNTFILLTTLCTLLSCKQDGPRTVAIETEFGVMKVELYDETPIHRDNFIKLAEEGFYDDLLFHRVIDGFMAQGGDPNSLGADQSARLGSGGPGYLLDAEIGYPHFKGTLAAARTGGPGNPERKSSGSQFYVVTGKSVSDAQLDSQERRFGFKYSQAQRDKYKKLGGTPMLDMDYTVFGEIVSGLEVADKIVKVKTGQADRPVNDVKMKVRVIN